MVTGETEPQDDYKGSREEKLQMGPGVESAFQVSEGCLGQTEPRAPNVQKLQGTKCQANHIRKTFPVRQWMGCH